MTGKQSVDMDYRADEAWVLDVQRRLYQQSKANPDETWRDLWGWLTDDRMIRHAWRRVSTNKGKRSAGVDGITVDRIRQTIGERTFLEGTRRELRSGTYHPSPSRRKLIPKAGKPGQFRPLGIPTVKDRVIQGAVKAVLEPIFEAQFWPVSYAAEARTAPWSISGNPCNRESGIRIADGTECRTNGSLKAT
jgi:RNA-directed DNA polymerase